MSPDRFLSQEETDQAFRKSSIPPAEDDTAKIQIYDFRRTERLPKDQIRAIRLLHENFSRRLATNLSAYLRAFVVVNLVSMEQVSSSEFTQALPSPTLLIALGLKPYDGAMILEIGPSLVFPILEMLLGGTSNVSTRLNRAVTEIEQNILDGLLGIVLNELRSAWLPVTPMEFSIDAHETEPQLSQIIPSNESIVAVSLEVRIGDNVVGMMNLGIPSTVLKMLRQKFTHHGVRKIHGTGEEQARALRLVQHAAIPLDACLRGPTLGVGAILDLKVGDVLAFDYVVQRLLDLMVSGKLKYQGEVVTAGRKRAFQIHQISAAPPSAEL